MPRIPALPPLLLLAALCPGVAAAQVVMGRVVEARTRAPLAGVDVRAELARDSVVAMKTGADGVFSLLLPGAGRYQLTLRVREDVHVVSDSFDLAMDAVLQREFLVEVPQQRALFEFQVEKPVRPLRGTVGPQYPPTMRASNIEGEVLAQFVVDTTGRPEPTSFRVLRYTNLEFVGAVRDAVLLMRFQPAEVGGRKVRQLVQQPFEFRLTAAPVVPRP
ncbi:TonB family protein [Roseisolibacter agri]|uniref:TonB C-terminal domain-containing protein n=1 Tax=Roseisolibacter agri TaxID=2014610 RepID=A0AA37V2P2_9BACT|nr:TonB family protein [Roseisolibacter agri]GLC25527.1 hypothetical protein rosag_20400 [Roseisolibacter agri]